jgi:hypothetical protein
MIVDFEDSYLPLGVAAVYTMFVNVHLIVADQEKG